MAVIAPDREHQVAAGEVLGNRPCDLGINLAVLEVSDRSPEVNTEHEGQSVLVQCAMVYEHGAERSGAHSLCGQCARELILRDESLGHQNLTEPALRRGRVSGPGVA